MDVLRKLADKLIGLSAFFGSVGLILVVLVILADVIGRFFNEPLLGARDVFEMTMVIVVFGGMALCDRQGGHIAMDLFERYYPPRINRWIDALSAALGAVLFLAIAWMVYESAKLSVMLNISTNLLDLPKAWFQWCLSALAVITAFAMIVRSLELFLGKEDVRNPTGVL